MKKSLILSFVLTLSAGLWAETIDDVKYINANGRRQTVNNVTEITNASDTLVAGWYVVLGSDVQTGSLVCEGEVHLILADGAKLTAKGGFNNAGIQVSGAETSLTIYGQTAQSGLLTANGGNNAAGIGGGNGGDGSNITINGGTVTATGGNDAAGIGGGNGGSGSDITINGGTVTANSEYGGAGIGGGNGSSGSNITINVGTITANGGVNAAGIGGGEGGSGSNITINGGTITANGGYNAAGIGGGYFGSGSNITINGGKVTANGGVDGAGIGGGEGDKSSTNITINGGEVTANGGGYGAGIGGGKYGSCSKITVNLCLIVEADTKELAPDRTSTTNIAGTLAGIQNVNIKPIVYIDKNGARPMDKLVNAVTNSSTTLTAGWYIVKGTNVQTGSLTCKGDVHLILADGAKLTATGANGKAGITVSGEGNSLTIYGQTAQTGQLIATGGRYGAGIGGGSEGEGSNITILGGKITATGGEDAAGIGGGYKGLASNIIVDTTLSIKTGTKEIATDRTFTTDIADSLKGIQSIDIEPIFRVVYIDENGIQQTCKSATVFSKSLSTLTTGWYVVLQNETMGRITCKGDVHLILADGVTLTANGGILVSGNNNSLTIYGQTTDFTRVGQLIATGGESDAGIGGGYQSSGSNITINGGKITATGGEDAAGIGGGYYSSFSNITINGGKVIATGGSHAAGIGSGHWKSSCSNIAIRGGIVIANGGKDAAAIGGGYNSSASNITVSTNLSIKTGTKEIATDRTSTTDITGSLGGIRNITIGPVLTNVSYIDEDGVEQYVKAWRVNTTDSTTWEVIDDIAWYVVPKNASINFTNSITCKGHVCLILEDGSSLTITGNYRQAGIQVSGEGNSLTIYGQTAQTGQLIVTGGRYGAGIGGGSEGEGSNITILGGKITATGGEGAAGIGEGCYSAYTSHDITVATTHIVKVGDNPENMEEIGLARTAQTDLADKFQTKQFATINLNPILGKVAYLDKKNVERYVYAMEITDSTSQVTWNEGWYAVPENTTVTLSKGAVCNGAINLILSDGSKLITMGGENQAGIQVSGEGNSLTIYGQTNQTGQLDAIGGRYGAGIGGGYCAHGCNIVICGGIITATGGEDAAGIGSGYNGPLSNHITASTSLIVRAGNNVKPTDKVATNRTSTTDITSAIAGYRYVTIKPDQALMYVAYIDEKGEEQHINAREVISVPDLATWKMINDITWYVVPENTIVNLAKGAICKGAVNLILADGAKLTATGANDQAGITVSGEGNSLTIYGQTAQTGQLIATGSRSSAGIGGGYNADGSNIIIYGGKVTATGGESGAGIGGGSNGNGQNITINRGEVIANGGVSAAGIGGGMYGSGLNIAINGGTITANGGYYGAGIGNGEMASDSHIFISDAYVLKAGATSNPTTIIPHSSLMDLGSILKQQYVKVEGLANPYTRTAMKDGQVGVVCLPYDATSFSGASFFQINYYEDDKSTSGYKFYLEEVNQLVAGMPYILLATSENVVINHNGVATLTYGEEKKQCGLHGTFARKVIQPDGKLAALVEADVSWLRKDIEIAIPACRAYFDLSEIPEVEQPHSAPLRCVSVPGQNPMGLFNINVNANTNKFLYNGQLYIRKNGKTYTIMGVGE